MAALQERAASAGQARDTFENMGRAYDEIGIGGVKLAGNPVTAGLARSIDLLSLGMNPTGAGTLDSMTGPAWAEAVAVLKGSLTQAEGARFENAVITASTDPAAKQYMVEAAKAVAARENIRPLFYEAYRNAKGTLIGADQQWERYKTSAPLLIGEKGKYQVNPRALDESAWQPFAAPAQQSKSDLILQELQRRAGGR